MHQEKKEVVLRLGGSIRKHRMEQKFSMEKLALESGMEYSQIRRMEHGVIKYQHLSGLQNIQNT